MINSILQKQYAHPIRILQKPRKRQYMKYTETGTYKGEGGEEEREGKELI